MKLIDLKQKIIKAEKQLIPQEHVTEDNVQDALKKSNIYMQLLDIESACITYEFLTKQKIDDYQDIPLEAIKEAIEKVTSDTNIEVVRLLLHEIEANNSDIQQSQLWNMRTQLAGKYGCEFATLKKKISKYEQNQLQETENTEAKPTTKNAICLLNEGHTAKQLSEMRFEPINWLIKSLVPAGLTLLCGKPKIGKSWLSLDITLNVATCNKVAQYFEPSKSVNTLYLSLEDHQRRLKTRINKIYPGTVPQNAFFYTECPRLDDGGLDAINEAIEKHSAEVVIVDTLAKVRPSAKRNQQNYDADYEALSGLKRLADIKNIAVIVVHHLRKMASDDPIDLVSGTLGLTGAADTILILQRDRRMSKTNTTLYCSGRDVPDTELAMTLGEDCVWQVLGDADKFIGSDVKQYIISALEKSAFAISPTQMADTCKKDIQQIKNILPQLIREGLVARAGYGMYQLGERYFQEDEPF